MKSLFDLIAKLVAWIITGSSEPEVSWKCFAQRIILIVVRFAILVGIVLLLRELVNGDILESFTYLVGWFALGGATIR